MAAEPLLRPLAVCEQCWLDTHMHWEPKSMNETGQILMKLVGVDTPNTASFGNVDICCMCGSITISGIYEMIDPTKVYFLEQSNVTNQKFEFEFGMLDEE